MATVDPYREPPAQAWRLGEAEIHIWRIALDVDPEHRLRLASLLGPEEQFRAQQYHFEVDRVRFTACRGWLRTLLGRYLQVAASAVTFMHGPEGKPALGYEFHSADLRFNVAHSQGLAIAAFSRGREVGVDLEQVRPLQDAWKIVDQFFSPREKALMAQLPPECQLEAFFHCWTRKEAVLKARGDGLSFPLDQVEVSLLPGDPARLVQVEDQPGESCRWRLLDLVPDEGFVGALAAERGDWEVVYRQVPAGWLP